MNSACVQRLLEMLSFFALNMFCRTVLPQQYRMQHQQTWSKSQTNVFTLDKMEYPPMFMFTPGTTEKHDHSLSASHLFLIDVALVPWVYRSRI